MDRGHASGTAYNNGSAQHAGAQNYSYNQSQSDPFNSFINTEDDAAFDNTWQTPDFTNQQPTASHDFEQSTHTWQHPPYQQPGQNYLHIPPYNAESSFPSSDSIFQQSAFEPNGVPELAGRQNISQQPYAQASGFNPAALNSESHYRRYSVSQDLDKANQTISPAAITSRPEFSESAFKSNGRPSQQYSQILAGSSQSHSAGIPPLTPLSIQDWRHFSNRTVKSIDRPGLHIKPTDKFENITQSKRFNGFIFIGNGSIAIDSSKANIPRYKRKKSRNEASKLLYLEKGDGPWHVDREPLVKKLKVAAKKQGGPRALTLAATKGTPSATESSGSDSDESSDYTSDSEAEEKPEEKFPLSGTKPTDPNKATEYDLVKAIWAKRSTVLSGPVIRTALGEVWDIMKGVRDQWKKKSALLQQAIDKKDQSTEKAFERRVADQRKLFETCNALILKHGHPSIIEKLGENPVMLVIFYQFLADRIKYSEYTGSFVNSILELLCHCRSVDATLLEKTKLDKLLPRFQKKGDERGKKFTKRILDNTKITDKKPVVDRPANGNSSDGKLSKTDPAKKDLGGLVTKTGSQNVQASGNDHTSKPIVSGGNAKVAPKVKLEGSPEVKTKVVNVAAKPSGFFSSLKSASKKPGTSSKTEDGTASQTKKPGNTTPVAKPAFSFAATMAGLAKQKEEPAAKVEDTRKPETEQEKAKRLRKESRRSLRVSFKADDELVAVRTFVHDPDEDIGHDQSQVRDVGDSKGEGQMLKMHKDLELDDEEDYEPPEEIIPTALWSAPTLVDFNSIEQEERARNFVSRGGLKELEPSANERVLQKEREQGTLMAFYTSKSDIPPSPREPLDSDQTSSANEMLFGELTDPTRSRLLEERVQRSTQQMYPTIPPTPDISALLSIINNAKQQPQSAASAPMQGQPAIDPSNPLAAILSKLPQNIQAQTQQPGLPPPPPPMAFNLQAALAGIQQAPQQNYQPQPAYAAQPANPVPNLQAVLSQIGNQAAAAAAAPPPPAMQSYGYTASNSAIPIHEDRKRQMEDDGNDQNRKRPRGGKPFTGAPYLPCKFWQEGKCRKGDDCTFLHETN